MQNYERIAEGTLIFVKIKDFTPRFEAIKYSYLFRLLNCKNFGLRACNPHRLKKLHLCMLWFSRLCSSLDLENKRAKESKIRY